MKDRSLWGLFLGQQRRGVLNTLLSRTLLEKKIGASAARFPAGVNERIVAVTGRGPQLDSRFLGIGISAFRIGGKYRDRAGLWAVEGLHEGSIYGKRSPSTIVRATD